MIFYTSKGIGYFSLNEEILRDCNNRNETFAMVETQIPYNDDESGTLSRDFTNEEFANAETYIRNNFSEDIVILLYPE